MDKRSNGSRSTIDARFEYVCCTKNLEEHIAFKPKHN